MSSGRIAFSPTPSSTDAMAGPGDLESHRAACCRRRVARAPSAGTAVLVTTAFAVHHSLLRRRLRLRLRGHAGRAGRSGSVGAVSPLEFAVIELLDRLATNLELPLRPLHCA